MTTTTGDDPRRQPRRGEFARDVRANVIANLIANWLTIGAVYVFGVWRQWWPQQNEPLAVVATLTVVTAVLGATLNVARHGLAKSWRRVAMVLGTVLTACLSAWGYSEHVPYFSSVCLIVALVAWILAPVWSVALIAIGLTRDYYDLEVTSREPRPSDPVYFA